MQSSGKKNKGAWYRANKAIHTLTNAEREDMVSSLGSDVSIIALFGQLQTWFEAAGVNSADFDFGDATAWMTQLLQSGIPWELWSGHPLHDSYITGTVPEHPERYAPVLTPKYRKASQAIRRTLTEFFRRRAVAIDMANEETGRSRNPGGRATGGA